MNKYKLAIAILTLIMTIMILILMILSYHMIGTHAITLWIGMASGIYIGWKLKGDWKI